MPAAPRSPNEAARLAALARYHVLDTPPAPEFDDITRLVANICGTPIAVVNLVGKDRQWFKSEIGLGVRETPLDVSICAHAILEERMLVVPDTTKDNRFACNPLVMGEPRLRFYAGAVLETSDNFKLGTLCVLDTMPRQLEPEQLEALQILARQTMQLLELHRRLVIQAALSRQLEEALDARERLLSMVAHDLRNPIGTVLMGAEYLEPEVKEGTQRRVVTRLQRAATGMSRMVEELLDESSIDAGRMPLDPQPASVAQVLFDAADAFEFHAEAASVRITVDAAGDLVLQCDVQRIQQVLGNLIGNALAITPPGGTIALSGSARNEGVVLTVRDTGPGLTAEQIERIFQPYWRGPNAKRGGLGLGLAISRRIVAAHGGRIDVDSTPGEGAAFCIWLPATPRTSSAVDEAEQ